MIPLAELSRYALRARMAAAAERCTAAQHAAHLRPPGEPREPYLEEIQASEAHRAELNAEFKRRNRLRDEANRAGAAERDARRASNAAANVRCVPYLIEVQPPKKKRGRRRVDPGRSAC